MDTVTGSNKVNFDNQMDRPQGGFEQRVYQHFQRSDQMKDER